MYNVAILNQGNNSYLDDRFWTPSFPYTWNSSLRRWEIQHKQALFGQLTATSDYPGTGDDRWTLDFRPSKMILEIEYAGGLSNCNIVVSLFYHGSPVVTNVTTPFLSGEKKTLEYSPSGYNMTPGTVMTGLYPFISENDPSPLFYITRLDFIL